MTLNKRERTLLEAIIGGQRETTWRSTHYVLVILGLVEGGNGSLSATPLGRFVGEPLVWLEYKHGWTTDFLGGAAFIQRDQRSEEFVWMANLRFHHSPEYQYASTVDDARAACEAWVDAERLRQAGGE